MASLSFFLNPNFIPIERFDMGRFMGYTDNLDPLTSEFFAQLVGLPTSGVYTIQGEEFRPDFLSDNIYNDPQYWWVLMMYNGLSDVNQVVTGLAINFPSIDALESLLFSLKSQETALLAQTGG